MIYSLDTPFSEITIVLSSSSVLSAVILSLILISFIFEMIPSSIPAILFLSKR